MRTLIRILLMYCTMLLFFLFARNVQAQTEWTPTQIKMGAAALALHTVDWGQTRHIAKNPDHFRELNPILGEHPSLGQVNRHFIISGLLVAGLAHYLPQYRSNILKIYIGIQTINTIRNYHIGLKMDF